MERRSILDEPPRLPLELAIGLFLLGAGLLPRLLVAELVPTTPVSDFRAVVGFALAFRDQGIVPGGYFWEVLNVGPAMAISLLYRLVPGDPDELARLATAAFTGLLGVVPFLAWRGVLRLGVRTVGGALLALWPGQVLFSGVVAQDNWVTPPTVALACVAARSLVLRRAHPLLAGVLFAMAVAMRQEMLYVLLPLLVAGAGVLQRETRQWRTSAVALLAMAVPLLALAWQRHAATGRFALASGHVGYTLLGTVAPGATRVGWTDPASFAASVRPDLTADRQQLVDAAMPLALAEVRRRPGFQVARAFGAGATSLFTSDADGLYWSLQADGALPAEQRAAGDRAARRLWPLLRLQSRVVQGLFLAALAIGIWRRSAPILVVSSAVLLKVGLHAALVSVGRFYVPVTAMQLVVVALGCWLVVEGRAWAPAATALVAGALAAAALFSGGAQAQSWVREHDRDPQLTYRFSLRSSSSSAHLDCAVSIGKVTLLGFDQVTIEPLPEGGSSGRAVAVCSAGAGAAPESVALELSSRATVAPAAQRAVERVEADGNLVLQRALPADGTSATAAVPLGTLSARRRRAVRIELGVPPAGSAGGGASTIRLLPAAGGG
jgi:hypothetical protein